VLGWLRSSGLRWKMTSTQRTTGSD